MKRGSLAFAWFVLLLTPALFFLTLDHLATPTIVLGPTPEAIEDHCQPVLEWITSRTDQRGRPAELPPELAAHMDGQPYPWRFSPGGTLYVGSPDHGWPLPLYSYGWSRRQGWTWWADDAVTHEEARAILAEHGYYGEAENG